MSFSIKRLKSAGKPRHTAPTRVLRGPRPTRPTAPPPPAPASSAVPAPPGWAEVPLAGYLDALGAHDGRATRVGWAAPPDGTCVALLVVSRRACGTPVGMIAYPADPDAPARFLLPTP